MITALDRVIPNRTVTAFEFVFDETVIAVGHTSVEFTAVVRIANETVLGAFYI